MNCGRCSATIAADSRFCAQCGAPVAQPCATCGATVAGSNGCLVCDGGEASPAALRNAVERRQLTILFYDLIGSTALAVRCDPEDFHGAIDRFHRTVVAAVEPFGARVGARIGDGGIVYFGYPLAHEGAAEGAILAGLAAVEAAAGVDLPDGTTARIRVGIATGQGIVGRLEEGNDGNAAVGRVTSLAARLQAVAPPNRVVIADATRRLVGSLFDLDDMGLVEAKGFDDPVQAWTVAGRATDDRFAALGAGETSALIGREPDRARLDAAWQRASGPTGQVVVLSGEAGVGKSHLAARFVRESATGSGAVRITLFGSPHAQHSPLRPFIVQLQRGGDAPEAMLAPGTPPGDAALLRALVDPDEPLPESFDNTSPAQRLDLTLDAFIHQVELISQARPVLLLFEDAHWADPTTLRLIDRAVGMAATLRGLLVITARPEFRPNWFGLPHVDVVELSPLADVDGATLIARVAGAEQLPPAIKRAILRRADGLPLFLQELTRAMVEASSAAAADPAAADLPSTLQDSLLARLDRLGPAKAVVQAGAVIGREFSAGLLARLTGRGKDDLTAGLDRLIAAGLIQTVGESYRFRHVLMQEAAYATLLRGERQRLNARLINALEDEFAADPAAQPEQLAHYAGEAGLFDVAADYWLRAGSAALAQSAMPEALARLQRGLTAVRQLAVGPLRWRRELALQLALGKALIATNGYAGPLVHETFTGARELCEASGDEQQLLAALHGLWVHDLLCARLDQAQDRADELLGLAEQRADPVWLLIGCRAQGVAAYPLGQFDRSRRYLERGLASFDPALRPAYAQILTDDARVVIRVYLSWSLVYLGDWHAAREHRDAAVAEARVLKQPYTLAHALNGRALTMLWMGETDGLTETLDELDVLTADHEISYFAVAATIMRGRALVRDGNLDDGIATLARGVADYRATRSVLYLPTFLTWLADALGQGGRVDDAFALTTEAFALIEATGMQNDAVETRRVHAGLLSQKGDHAAADAMIAEARIIADEQGIAPAIHRLDGNGVAPMALAAAS